ncbi:MAG: hypothetical protein ACWGSD_06410 [Thermodesulfobacteriota bacterium]
MKKILAERFPPAGLNHTEGRGKKVAGHKGEKDQGGQEVNQEQSVRRRINRTQGEQSQYKGFDLDHVDTKIPMQKHPGATDNKH